VKAPHEMLSSSLPVAALPEPAVPLLADGVIAVVADVTSSIPPAPGPANGTLPAAQAAASSPKPREAARRLFLERSAVTLGQTWAEEWRADLRREGRPAAGGWPGTLREARVRVERFLLAEMSRRKMAAVTEAEREVAARAAYASARHEWCRQAEPEAP
jgi:hypothetical protein